MRRTICLVLLMLVAGCGIKPRALEAPQGRDQDHFPHTYPHEGAAAP